MSDNAKPIDVHDYYQLKLMEHVEQTPRLNNRQASKILGVSVKLAHDILTRMAKKGYFHITKHHARRWDYFLTPKGITEKARLTVEFLDFSMHFYREARRRSAQVCRDLAEAGKNEVALLGSNELAEICNLGIQEWGLTLEAVFDEINGETRKFLNHNVQDIAGLPKYNGDAIIVCLYDPSEPKKKSFLPESIKKLDGMFWIF